MSNVEVEYLTRIVRELQNKLEAKEWYFEKRLSLLTEKFQEDMKTTNDLLISLMKIQKKLDKNYSNDQSEKSNPFEKFAPAPID